MRAPTRHFIGGLLLGIVASVLAVILIGLGIAYGGAYDIAASSGHTAGMHWLLDTTMHRSVRSRASEPPDAALAAADVAAGAAEFKAMCEHCHGAPGVEPQPWSRGMLPQPPDLAHEAGEWEAGEVLWIVRHGIKYTGMPSFGHDHDEATLLNIAAFVKQLPGMTPAGYAASAAGGHHGQGSGEHGEAPGSDAPAHDDDHGHE